MIIVQNRIRISEQFRNQFLERFKDRDSSLKNQKGFVSNYILEPTGKDDEFVVMTIWDNQNSFELWTKSEDFNKSHSNPMPQGAVLDRPILKVHTVVSKISNEV